MWELDYKESWALKNWCLWTVVLEKTLESPLDSKEIQPVHPKGNQSWIFIGRTDAEAETPMLWPPDAKNWLIGKDLDAGKDRGGEGDDRGWWLDGIIDSMDMNCSTPGLPVHHQLLEPTHLHVWVFPCSSVQFSCSVVSDCLQPHELEHASSSVLHYLLEFVQIHVHWVGDAI